MQTDGFGAEALAQIEALEAIRGQVRMRRDRAAPKRVRAADGITYEYDYARGYVDAMESVMHTLGETLGRICAKERARLRSEGSDG